MVVELIRRTDPVAVKDPISRPVSDRELTDATCIFRETHIFGIVLVVSAQFVLAAVVAAFRASVAIRSESLIEELRNFSVTSQPVLLPREAEHVADASLSHVDECVHGLPNFPIYDDLVSGGGSRERFTVNGVHVNAPPEPLVATVATSGFGHWPGFFVFVLGTADHCMRVVCWSCLQAYTAKRRFPVVSARRDGVHVGRNNKPSCRSNAIESERGVDAAYYAGVGRYVAVLPMGQCRE